MCHWLCQCELSLENHRLWDRRLADVKRCVQQSRQPLPRSGKRKFSAEHEPAPPGTVPPPAARLRLVLSRLQSIQFSHGSSHRANNRPANSQPTWPHQEGRRVPCAAGNQDRVPHRPGHFLSTVRLGSSTMVKSSNQTVPVDVLAELPSSVGQAPACLPGMLARRKASKRHPGHSDRQDVFGDGIKQWRDRFSRSRKAGGSLP